MIADAEVLTIACEVLEALEVGPFTIKVNQETLIFLPLLLLFFFVSEISYWQVNFNYCYRLAQSSKIVGWDLRSMWGT
jgi:hypothetical protein